MKPAPKTVKVVCEACGLDWDQHGAKPTLSKCVELLKAELASRPTQPWYSLNQPATTYSSQLMSAAALKQVKGVPIGDTKVGKAH